MENVRISRDAIWDIDYRYQPGNHTIVVPGYVGKTQEEYGLYWTETTIYDLLSILHELGHASYRHEWLILVQEKKAWRYALRCLRLNDRQKRDIGRWIVKQLATYTKT